MPGNFAHSLTCRPLQEAMASYGSPGETFFIDFNVIREPNYIVWRGEERGENSFF